LRKFYTLEDLKICYLSLILKNMFNNNYNYNKIIYLNYLDFLIIDYKINCLYKKFKKLNENNIKDYNIYYKYYNNLLKYYNYIYKINF